MATKAFYRSKNHYYPLNKIYKRAAQALERGVPIGRGHLWAIEEENASGRYIRLPDWTKHEWTINIRDALAQVPTASNIPLKTPQKKREYPIIPLLKSFLSKHPEVAWKVPFESSSTWAPTLFVYLV